MPGVTVTTDVRSGPVAPDIAPGATAFLVGIAERGDATRAVELWSYADYRDKLGAWVGYGALADQVRCYFEEGGSHCYVARVVGPAASVGSLVLQDRAGVPVNTLRIDAKDPGPWSAAVTVQVENGGQAGTFRLTVRYAGTGGPSVEVYDNLATVAAAVAALATSAYVRGVDLASPSAAALAIPAVRAATALSAGADDRGSVSAATMLAALARFGADLGPGAVGIPGQTSAAVGPGLEAHAAANRREAIISVALGATDAAAIAEAQALRDNVGADAGGIFGPWVWIPDDAGGRRLVDPVGYVMGCRARAHLTVGPFQPGAGTLSAARFVLDVERVIDRAAGDALDAGEVNAIRRIRSAIGDRVEVYGWRSLSRNERDFYLLTARATLNVLDWQASLAAEGIVFRVIDSGGAGRPGRTLSDLGAVLTAVAMSMADAGGLFPGVDDPGWRVDVGPTVNPPGELAQHRVTGALLARVAESAALVAIHITKVAVDAAL